MTTVHQPERRRLNLLDEDGGGTSMSFYVCTTCTPETTIPHGGHIAEWPCGFAAGDDATMLWAHDARDGSTAEARSWLTEHGIDPNHTYRVEIWRKPQGGRVLRAFCFAVDENGHHYVEDGDLAKQKPADIPLTSTIPRFA